MTMIIAASVRKDQKVRRARVFWQVECDGFVPANRAVRQYENSMMYMKSNYACLTIVLIGMLILSGCTPLC